MSASLYGCGFADHSPLPDARNQGTPGDVCVSDGIPGQAGADELCPGACTAEALVWNGHWTNEEPNVSDAGCPSFDGVCGCIEDVVTSR